MFIQNLSARRPKRSVNLLEQHEMFNLTYRDAMIYNRFIGIEQVPVAVPGEMEALLDAVIADVAPVDCRDRISIVVHAHTCPIVGKYGAHAMQHILRQQGLNKALLVGTCANRCASIFDAMRLIQGWLKQRPDRLGLLVTGECALTQELRLVENTALTGDAAGAILFGWQGGKRQLLACCLQIQGQYAAGVWLDSETRAHYELNYQAMMRKIVRQTLTQARVTLDRVRWVIPHNVNRQSWVGLAKALGLPLSRVMLANIPRTGHCFGSDMMLNLCHLESAGVLMKGDIYLMIAVGLGGSFGTALFRH